MLFTMKDKLFVKLHVYLRYFKRKEEINNDKKIISNQPIIISQIQPFTLSDIHNLSRRFYISFRENYSRDAVRLCACFEGSKGRKYGTRGRMYRWFVQVDQLAPLIKKANGGRVQAAERFSTSALVAHWEIFELYRCTTNLRIRYSMISR